MKMMVLTEKKSAKDAFKSALGGDTGTVETKDGLAQFVLVNASGHLLELKSPEYQPRSYDAQQELKDWNNISSIPWNLKDFKWDKQISKGKKSYIDTFKAVLQSIDTIVIATDTDPSGEGDVLAWEIIDVLGWHGKVYRLRFKSQNKNDIQKAFKQNFDFVSREDPIYLKGLSRERFDFGTMSLSRVGTYYAKQQNYSDTMRFGRLISLIMTLVYVQEKAVASYVKAPLYSAEFKDENGNRFKSSKEEKYKEKALAEQRVNELSKSSIEVLSPILMQKIAPKMPDIGGLGALLPNVDSDKLLKTYQEMYEADVVSYPRTEDNAVSKEDWEAMLAYKDDVARVVGVDPGFLTETDPREPYVSNKDLAHGANRPGPNVPKSLNEIEQKYGKVGVQIYTVLAKRYLATLMLPYEYEQTKAIVKDYPDFSAISNIPKSLGYKAILQGLEEDDKKKKESTGKMFGSVATPTVHQGFTTKPKEPTRTFILTYLKKKGIGTGATRLSTIKKLEKPDNKKQKPLLIKNKKGVYSLTPTGYLNAALAMDTMLASPTVTKQLQDIMDMVEQGKADFDTIYQALNMIIKDDKNTMKLNANSLKEDDYLRDKLPYKSVQKSEFVYGPTGETVKFKTEWGYKGRDAYKFSDQDIEMLLNGEEITFEVVDKNGKTKRITGCLGKKSWNNREYWTFIPMFDKEYPKKG